MKKQIRIVALAVAAIVGLGLLAPLPARAGSKGRRNTAIALTVVGIYGVAARKPLIAGLGLGGAAYSYTSSLRARDRERRCRSFRSPRRYGHRKHRHAVCCYRR